MNGLEMLAAQDLLSEMNSIIYENESLDNAIDTLIEDYYIKEENCDEL